jgi:hypothetical protein
MRINGLVTTVALVLTLSSNAFADGPASRTAPGPGPIRASVQSARWVSDVDHLSKGWQGPYKPSGSGPRGQMSRRQVAIILGMVGGAVGGFFVADAVCQTRYRNECDLPGVIFGTPIGAAAGGITVAWLTK